MLRTTRRAAIALAALIAAVALVPATSQAATKQTRIVFDSAFVIGQPPITRGMGGAEDFLITGHLRSAGKCLGGRKMTMVAIRAGERRKVDTDRSSGAGAWAFRGRLNSSVDDLKISVRRSRAGGDVCGSDTLRLRGGAARLAD